jgi:hypothetical protein
VPVTKLDAALARNTAMPAKSSGAPQRAAGVRAGDPLLEARDVPARLARERGVDPAGQHGIDLDVVLGPGAGERPGELHDAALVNWPALGPSRRGQFQLNMICSGL